MNRTRTVREQAAQDEGNAPAPKTGLFINPVIGKLPGHSRLETTARYAHLARDSAQEAAERVAESIAEDFL